MTAKMYLDLGIKLVKKGDIENATTAFCTAIKLDQSYAPAYNNLGLIFKNTERLGEAEACFCRAIELDSKNWHAYNNLGLVFLDVGDLQQAEACFRKATELYVNSPAIYNNLGIALEEQYQLFEAEKAYERAVQLKPDFPEAHHNLGRILRMTRRFAEAEQHFFRAVELRPGYSEAKYSLAIFYLLCGEFGRGWREYEQSRLTSYRYRQLDIPHWRGEDLTGKHILLCWEHGFGDTIQFARYAQMVEQLASKTSLWVQKPLERLLSTLFPSITVLAGECPLQARYDYVCSLLSLPAIFNTCSETIPQPVPYAPVKCAASAFHRETSEKMNGNRVGVVWAGNPKHANDAQRSIPFTVFQNLFRVPGVSWVSLQVGPRAEDLMAASCNISDSSSELADFLDTAELLEDINLVITVDTAVAHVAGSMGKETWVLLPYDPDWRWQLDREDSPWYPAVRLFRQRKPGEWQEVIERVRMALQQKAAGISTHGR
ncbi:tetratricopeptide repeat protein [Sporomusa aerivorans]|uniref:tetratricopeptide repeat protein n=1 Tax=Sporomusa aerivorans TaxID=204936 RepID=UPI00352BBA6C